MIHDTAQQRFPHERQQRMAALIANRGSLTIADLSNYFGASAPTIRRDLALLEKAGLAARTHGGVMAPGGGGALEPLFMEKLRLHQSLKTRIGTAASRHVADGQRILLDSGTTTLALATALAGRPLTIITMDLKVAEIAATGDTEVHLIGGQVRNGYYSLVGAWSLAALSDMNCHTFFMAADAIDPAGISNSTAEEAEVKRAAMSSVQRTVLLADHSKLDRQSIVPVCALDAIDLLITDRRASARLAPYRNLIRNIEAC